MKRHPALVSISMEHHRSLLLAKHCKVAAASGDATRIQRQVEEILQQRDLWARHFHKEEQCLFEPARALEPALVARLLREHEQMLDWVARMQAGEHQWLQAFGELLGEHTRVEERRLLPALESLSEADLQFMGRCLEDETGEHDQP